MPKSKPPVGKDIPLAQASRKERLFSVLEVEHYRLKFLSMQETEAGVVSPEVNQIVKDILRIEDEIKKEDGPAPKKPSTPVEPGQPEVPIAEFNEDDDLAEHLQ